MVREREEKTDLVPRPGREQFLSGLHEDWVCYGCRVRNVMYYQLTSDSPSSTSLEDQIAPILRNLDPEKERDPFGVARGIVSRNPWT